MTVCEKCGADVPIGHWPFCPHGAVASPARGFEPRFDMGLGEYVTGWGDVKQHMRRKKLDFRDHLSPGEINARKDRAHARRKARAR